MHGDQDILFLLFVRYLAVFRSWDVCPHTTFMLAPRCFSFRVHVHITGVYNGLIWVTMMIWW